MLSPQVIGILLCFGLDILDSLSSFRSPSLFSKLFGIIIIIFLTRDFSLKSMCQQVSSGLQESYEYSSWF